MKSLVKHHNGKSLYDTANDISLGSLTQSLTQ